MPNETMKRGRAVALLAGVLAMIAADATGALAVRITPAQRCEAKKNDVAGTYAECLATAEKRLLLYGDATEYNDKVARCEAEYSRDWQVIEGRAGAGNCPSEGDEAEIQNFVEACRASIADAVGGGSLPDDPVTCSGNLDTCNSNLGACTTAKDQCIGTDLPACNAGLTSCETTRDQCTGTDLPACSAGLTSCETTRDQCTGTDLPACSANLAACQAHTCGNNLAETAESCDGVDLQGKTCATEAPSTPYGTLVCNACAFDTSGCRPRFVDNGETITDFKTGLLWEKKTNDGSIHDKDLALTWTAGGPPYLPNGTAFTDFIDVLNGSQGDCFAGICDWRMPTRGELRTLIDETLDWASVQPVTFSAFHHDCSAGCSADTCSCTQWAPYWSITSTNRDPFDFVQPTANQVWLVNPYAGDDGVEPKALLNSYYARAVRGPL